MKSIYSEFQLEQQIDEYTRVATVERNGALHISKSLIDHFATNRPDYILRSNVLKIGMTDHYLISAIRKINAKRLLGKQVKLVETRSLRNYDKQLFLDELATIDWNEVMTPTNGDPDLMASIFNNVISSLLETHAPLKRRKVANSLAPWITSELKNLMKERDMAKKRSETNASYWPVYKKLRNKVNYELRVKVQEYYHNLIEDTKNNPKAMWKTINKVLHKNSNQTATPKIIFEGAELKTSSQISEAFNKHFVTVGPKLAEKIEEKPFDNPLSYLSNEPNRNKFKLEPVSVGYVQRAIRALDSSKSPGPDRIPVKILKDAISIVSEPLTLIYNASLEKGVFPQTWKLARVTPIFKAGNKTDVNDYRPISVLSVVSRILEKIVHDQLMEYLKEQNKLCLNQFAFQKLHSTITCLLNVIDPWFKNSDEGKINLSVFLDLKKAFDTVDHKILLSKLQAYGAEGISHNWFTSYLTNREQFCYFDGSSSRKSNIKCGIPQGSCLGPLLFILYINDFENCLENMIPNMYADDTSVNIASENLNELLTDLRSELENVSTWMRINKLSLNANKSEYMVIGHKRHLNRVVGDAIPDLVLNNEVIKRVDKTKYLGINIDENLNWKEQYKTVKNKLKGGLGSLRKLKNILPQKKLDQVYKALFESHLRYGNIVWGSLSETKLAHLQRLQTKARGLIEGAKYKDGWTCNWLDVKSLFSFDQGVMTYKILHDLCPSNLCQKFTKRSSISEYRTRNQRDLEIPKVRLEYAKRSFYFSGVKNWNDIPISIREKESIARFKTGFREYLLNQ